MITEEASMYYFATEHIVLEQWVTAMNNLTRRQCNVLIDRVLL